MPGQTAAGKNANKPERGSYTKQNLARYIVSQFVLAPPIDFLSASRLHHPQASGTVLCALLRHLAQTPSCILPLSLLTCGPSGSAEPSAVCLHTACAWHKSGGTFVASPVLRTLLRLPLRPPPLR